MDGPKAGGEHPMSPGVRFTQSWVDDVAKLQISVANGCFRSEVWVFADLGWAAALAAELSRFSDCEDAKPYDIRLGKFGHHFAGGAFDATLQLVDAGDGHLYVTVRSESQWTRYNNVAVADSSLVHLTSGQAQLDHFSAELVSIAEGTLEQAWLAGIDDGKHGRATPR